MYYVVEAAVCEPEELAEYVEPDLEEHVESAYPEEDVGDAQLQQPTIMLGVPFDGAEVRVSTGLHHSHQLVQRRQVVLHQQNQLQSTDDRKFNASLGEPDPPDAGVLGVLQLVAEGRSAHEVHVVPEAEQLQQVVLVLGYQLKVVGVHLVGGEQIPVVVVSGRLLYLLGYLEHFAVNLVVADELEHHSHQKTSD